MAYRVLIHVQSTRQCKSLGWWSDQKPFDTFHAAARHRKLVAQRWNDCDTAIAAPDGRTLAFQESLLEQTKLTKMLVD